MKSNGNAQHIAYLGKVQLSDTDLPLLNEMQKCADVTYFLEVNPRFMQGPAYNIKTLYPKSGLFPALEAYPEFERLSRFIDTSKFYVVNTTGRLWVLKSFWTHLLLLVFLIRRKFNVIHLAWPPNVYEFMLYFLRRHMVLTVHDPFIHTGRDSIVVRLRRKMAFRLIPYFIILNKAQRQEFLDFYHLSSNRVTTAFLSCCTYLRMVQPDLSTLPTFNPQPSQYILFSGKISPYKGLDYLLPAMKKVHEQCPDCRLVVAGGGEYHFDITPYQNLSYVEIRNRFIPEEELVALISHSQFMVCPYTDATQSGVVMSAFAFDKPVIATNVGGLPEMVKDGRYGIIVKEKDCDKLAEAIVRLWTQKELAESFSRNIHHDYSTGELSWRKAAEQFTVLYEAINKE